MSSDLTDDEARALLEEPAPARARGAVSPRDFHTPRRLSPAALSKLARRAARALPEVEKAFAAFLRTEVEVEIASLGEVDARVLLDGWRDPLCVVCFDVAGAPCWLAWEPSLAAAAAEAALGAGGDGPARPARPLSTVEATLVGTLLARAAAVIAGALGVEAKGPRLVQRRDALASLDDLPARADLRRISVEVALRAPVASGSLRVYLAGVAAPAEEPHVGAAKRAPLPGHLGPIEVEVGARLGAVDVALEELLALEVGDVVPLGAGSGALVEIVVEGEACALARFGEHQGKLAVRIEKVTAAAKDGGRDG